MGVTGIGPKQPTVINDLNLTNSATLPALDREQHLSMSCIRLLLIEIRKQLETISSDQTDAYQGEIKQKVKRLLHEFQSASQEYEQKMNEFKQITHSRLLERCGKHGSVLEMYCVIGVDATKNNEPKSEWIKVTVNDFDAANNRVLVKKCNDGTMQYAAIDSATLRIPESESACDQILLQNKAMAVAAAAAAAQAAATTNSHSNANSNGNSNGNAMTNNIQFNNISNHNTMNFNAIPSIPISHIGNGILPPFDALQANNLSHPSTTTTTHQHHISNTINTNNNISINGSINGNVCDPIVIQSDDEKNKKKLKRSRSSSKRRKLKDSDSESSSSNDSDDSM